MAKQAKLKEETKEAWMAKQKTVDEEAKKAWMAKQESQTLEEAAKNAWMAEQEAPRRLAKLDAATWEKAASALASTAAEKPAAAPDHPRSDGRRQRAGVQAAG